MERSEIRGGVDASRQSRISLRSIRATHLKDRAKIAFCESFPRIRIDFRLWSHRASKPLRSNVSRQQSRRFNDLHGQRIPNSATAFDNRRRISLKAKYLAHRRAHSGCDPEGGASAVPARGFANRSRAASAPRSSGTMTGPRGARCTGAGEGPPVCTRWLQETRPGAASGVTAWREPRWSAERRARSDERAAAPEARLGGNI